jgi:hypothetical protein
MAAPHGSLVTLGGKTCWQAIAQTVRAAGGDYLLTLDEGPMRDAAEQCFTRAYATNMAGREHDDYEIEERSRGCTERRCCTVIYRPQELCGGEGWDGLEVVGQLYRELTAEGEMVRAVRYFVGSRRTSAKRYVAALRGRRWLEGAGAIA